MRSSKDRAIALLNKWKSDATRIMVVFRGTLNRVSFTITGGSICEVSPGSFSVSTAGLGVDSPAMLSVSVSGAEFNIGKPVETDPLSLGLRSREIEVMEIFWGDDILTVFELLPAIDAPTILQ